MEIITPESSSDFEERLDKLEKQFRLHNHADGITQPVFVGKVNQGASNLLIPPSGGVLGEGVNNGDALRMGMAKAPRISQLLSNSTFVSSTSSPTYQTFKSGELSSFAGMKLWVNNDTDYSLAVLLYLYSDNNGSIGSLLDGTHSSLVPAHTSAILDLFFLSPVSLEQNKTYWLKFDGGNSGLSLLYYNTEAYLDGKFMNKDFIELGDVKMVLYFGETIGQIYKCAALSENETNAFIGIANKDGLTGENVDMVAAGFKTDYSGLTAGSVYYLTNSRGIIGTSHGLYTKKVAYAYNSTTLGINLF